MPEGPFGGPRLTNIGPFSRKTDEEVAKLYLTADDEKRKQEAHIRRTIIDSDRFTQSGKPDVIVRSISMIFMRGVTASYGNNEIDITFEPVYLSHKHGNEYTSFVKALIAHEYVHHILREEKSDEKVREAVINLQNSEAFDYRNVTDIPNAYTFPQEQLEIEYTSLDRFIDHLIRLRDASEPSRPAENLANLMSLNYADMEYTEFNNLRDEVHRNAEEIIDEYQQSTDIHFPEAWRITW